MFCFPLFAEESIALDWFQFLAIEDIRGDRGLRVVYLVDPTGLEVYSSRLLAKASTLISRPYFSSEAFDARHAGCSDSSFKSIDSSMNQRHR